MVSLRARNIFVPGRLPHLGILDLAALVDATITPRELQMVSYGNGVIDGGGARTACVGCMRGRHNFGRQSSNVSYSSLSEVKAH